MNQSQPEETNTPETKIENNSNPESPKTDVKKSKKNYSVFIVVAVVILIAGVIYFQQNSQQVEDNVAGTIDFSSEDPSAVVATVNGEEILQGIIDDRLREAAQIIAEQGIDLSDQTTRSQISEQILEDTIGYTLLRQGANEAGAVADQAKLEETFQTFLAQAGSSEQFIAQLQQAGLTEDTFRERLAEQLMIETYINDNVNILDINITDEEISTFYDTAIPAGTEGAPQLDEIRDQIIEQLTQQRRQELIIGFTDSLRETANIERN